MANQLTPAKLRRWAKDQRDYYSGSRMAERSRVFGDLLIARADLIDARADADAGTAEAGIAPDIRWAI